jgi:hypothetical protein
MTIILNITLGILLGAIIYQDFKYRAIHVFLVIGVFICSCLLLWQHQKSLTPMFYTSIFLITVLVLLWIYITLKNRNIDAITKGIGIGDVLFFFAVSPLFSLRNYMLFFISGMIITLIFYILFRNLMKTKLIPLAGILSGHLIVLKILSLSLNFDLFYNPIIIKAFGN